VELKPQRRAEVLCEGLTAIAANVQSLTTEISNCGDAARAGGLAFSVAREEAGKFLALLDVYRSPSSTAEVVTRQFRHASKHLSKLIYASTADASIADRSELLQFVNRNRLSHHLDGPMDCDWVFRNELLSRREEDLYVDLVESEGELSWIAPLEVRWQRTQCRSIMLVHSIMDCGLVTPAGLAMLQDVWRDFDARLNSHCSEWARRTAEVLDSCTHDDSDEWFSAARRVVDIWPMPMVEFDMSVIEIPVQELLDERDRRWNDHLAREYGYPYVD